MNPNDIRRMIEETYGRGAVVPRRTSDMPTISCREVPIATHFGVPLAAIGFKPVGARKWVRATKLPLRELFELGADNGGTFAPTWGFSTGEIPSWQRQFRRQSTDKNAIMGLMVDSRLLTPPAPQFGFITGFNIAAPVAPIRACADFCVPRAMRDFDRIGSPADFRVRFKEYMATLNLSDYFPHQLTLGFVQLWDGEIGAGLKTIRALYELLRTTDDDKILQECIRHATGR